MAISHATSFPTSNTSSPTSQSASWKTIGDLALLLFSSQGSSSTDKVTAVSSSKVSAWTVAVAGGNASAGTSQSIAYGPITATGSDTITITWSSTPSGYEAVLDELTAGLGSGTTWAGVAANQLFDASPLYVDLTSGSAALQAYWAYMEAGGSGSAGTTSGFSYYNSTNGNEVAFDGTLAASTSYQPNVGGFGGNVFSTGVIVSASSGGGATVVTKPLIVPNQSVMRAANW